MNSEKVPSLHGIIVSATKYLVEKYYDNKGNSGKSKDNSFWVFVVVEQQQRKSK